MNPSPLETPCLREPEVLVPVEVVVLADELEGFLTVLFPVGDLLVDLDVLLTTDAELPPRPEETCVALSLL